MQWQTLTVTEYRISFHETPTKHKLREAFVICQPREALHLPDNTPIAAAAAAAVLAVLTVSVALVVAIVFVRHISKKSGNERGEQ